MDEITIEQVAPARSTLEKSLALPLGMKNVPLTIPPSPTTEIDAQDGLEAGITIPTRTNLQRYTILATINFSVFLASLDTTITTTAIPTIAAYFKSSTGYTWIGSSFLLATAASTPTWVSLSQIFGRKPALLLSLFIFFLGSLLCSFAPSMAILIFGRAVQGTGCGGILVIANVVAGDLYSLRSRGAVYSFQSLVYAVAAAVGPVIGGVCAERGWRWCFYITLPTPIIAIILLYFVLDLPSPKTPLLKGLKALDWVGSTAIVGATICLLLGLEFGGVIFAWDNVKIIILLVIGVVMSVGFFFNEKKWARIPIMPLRLFSSRNNIAAICVGFFHGMTYFAPTYYLPLLFQSIHTRSPIHSGLLTLPYEISLSLASGVSGLLMKLTGHYTTQIFIGFSFLLLSLLLLANLTNPATPIYGLVLVEIVGGIGSGLTYSPPLLALQRGVQPPDEASATATYRFIRELATSIAIVLGGVVFQNSIQSQHGVLVAKLGEDIANLFSGKEAAANVLLIVGFKDGVGAVVKEAYGLALRRMWWLFVGTAVGGLVAAVGVVGGELSGVHVERVLGIEAEEEKSEDGLELRAGVEDT